MIEIRITTTATAAIPAISPVDTPPDLDSPVRVDCDDDEVWEADEMVAEVAVECGEFAFKQEASFELDTVSRSEAPPACPVESVMMKTTDVPAATLASHVKLLVLGSVVRESTCPRGINARIVLG